ncbi:MAG: metallophosphoesterase [Clostridia bacterium]|nr:metallophosphoesterase [Clostridia bacterium]
MKNKVKKTGKQKFKKFLKVFVSIIAVLAIIICCAGSIAYAGYKKNMTFVSEKIEKIDYENQLIPAVDKDGNFEFVTDNDFRIMQLTDVHIGTGFMSIKKDNMALNSVAAMITEEKPDLVILTGDTSFPFPHVAGTIDNKTSATLVAEFMEKLGVYWCLVYGNHDTEDFSLFSREEISALYENREKYPHCLFSTGADSADGCGNYVINVKNSLGKITQSIFMLDSHSYIPSDFLGFGSKYDCVHKNQIEWYQNELKSFTQQNGGETPKSLVFMHIPPVEMRDACQEYEKNGNKDTADVKYIWGEKRENVCSGEQNEGLFDACIESKSTQAIFFGHDHINNIELEYKGVRLCYGNSIDYLAYKNIDKQGAQRGCKIISVSPDGSFDISRENYYQEKYTPVIKKEAVTMEIK